MTTTATWAGKWIADHGTAALALVTAVKECNRLGALRAQKKVEAVQRLMKEYNWSQSRADDLAMCDTEYAAYKQEVADAELARLTCALNLENAGLAARLEIARLAQENTSDTNSILEQMTADIKKGLYGPS